MQHTPATTKTRTLSIRATAAFLDEVAENARRVGVPPSEYARLALEAYNDHQMRLRMEALSAELSEQSGYYGSLFDGTAGDGLERR